LRKVLLWLCGRRMVKVAVFMQSKYIM
jgi:hypothetical protein